jgi:hypothetical protein
MEEVPAGATSVDEQLAVLAAGPEGTRFSGGLRGQSQLRSLIAGVDGHVELLFAGYS